MIATVPCVEPVPGVYDDIDGEAYHQGPGISKSGLDLVHRSPAHYQYARENPGEPTRALAVGTATHTLILEPARFDDAVAVAPALDKRTKAGREQWAQFEADNAHRTIITAQEHEEVLGMAAAVDAHPYASILLRADAGPVEQTVYWHTEAAGLPVLCKCRPDKVNTEHNVVIDLKTTREASWDAFSKSTANYRYHLQAAWYLHGLAAVERPMSDFVFVAVEKTPPYGVGCYSLAAEDIERAWLMAERDLAVYAQCLVTDEWPSYPQHIRELILPKWTWVTEPEERL